MSNPHSHTPPEGHHGHQVEDEIAYGKIIAIAVVSLIVFALSTLWAALIMRQEMARVQKGGAAKVASEIGRQEIGIVDQVPFATDKRLSLWRAERAARLNGYGWVDRAKGVTHVPIEKAMDAVASGALPPGAPR